MFRKNKYTTNYSSCQHCATVQSSFCLQEGSSALTCCVATLAAVAGGLLHHRVWSNARSHPSLQHLQRSTLPAAGWCTSAIPSECPPTASPFAISFAQSQYLSLHHSKQTERSVSQSFRSGQHHELWLVSSLAERLLLALLHHSCPLSCSGDGPLLAQLLIEFRFQKPWV